MYSKCEWFQEGQSSAFVDLWHHESVLRRPLPPPPDQDLRSLLQIVHVLRRDSARLFWGHTWKTKDTWRRGNVSEAYQTKL